jgi:thioredoxin-dependent peroxiredoxin
MRREGDMVPAFELSAHDGTTFKFPTGKTTVLFFYPKDNTPGCTVENKEFTQLQAAFDAAGVVLAGISKDSAKTHCGFREKHGLSVLLLTDEEHAIGRIFGAFGDKVMYGRKVQGVTRSTFLMDGAGKVLTAWPTVKVEGHAAEVLAAAKGEPLKKTRPNPKPVSEKLQAKVLPKGQKPVMAKKAKITKVEAEPPKPPPKIAPAVKQPTASAASASSKRPAAKGR